MNHFQALPTELEFLRPLLLPGLAFDATETFTFGHPLSQPVGGYGLVGAHISRDIVGAVPTQDQVKKTTSAMDGFFSLGTNAMTTAEILECVSGHTTSLLGRNGRKKRKVRTSRRSRGQYDAEAEEAEFWAFLSSMSQLCKECTDDRLTLAQVTNPVFVSITRAIYEDCKSQLRTCKNPHELVKNLAGSLCNALTEGESLKDERAEMGHKSRKRKKLAHNKVVRHALHRFGLDDDDDKNL